MHYLGFFYPALSSNILNQLNLLTLASGIIWRGEMMNKRSAGGGHCDRNRKKPFTTLIKCFVRSFLTEKRYSYVKRYLNLFYFQKHHLPPLINPIVSGIIVKHVFLSVIWSVHPSGPWNGSDGLLQEVSRTRPCRSPNTRRSHRCWWCLPPSSSSPPSVDHHDKRCASGQGNTRWGIPIVFGSQKMGFVWVIKLVRNDFRWNYIITVWIKWRYIKRLKIYCLKKAIVLVIINFWTK